MLRHGREKNIVIIVTSRSVRLRAYIAYTQEYHATRVRVYRTQIQHPPIHWVTWPIRKSYTCMRTAGLDFFWRVAWRRHHPLLSSDFASSNPTCLLIFLHTRLSISTDVGLCVLDYCCLTEGSAYITVSLLDGAFFYSSLCNTLSSYLVDARRCQPSIMDRKFATCVACLRILDLLTN